MKSTVPSSYSKKMMQRLLLSLTIEKDIVITRRIAPPGSSDYLEDFSRRA